MPFDNHHPRSGTSIAAGRSQDEEAGEDEDERRDGAEGVVRATRTTASKGLRRIHSVRAPPYGGGLDPRRVRRVARRHDVNPTYPDVSSKW